MTIRVHNNAFTNWQNVINAPNFLAELERAVAEPDMIPRGGAHARMERDGGTAGTRATNLVHNRSREEQRGR